MDSVCGDIAGTIANVAIDHVEREVGYLLCFRSNTNNLSTKIGQLRALRTDMQTKVDATNDRNEVIKKRVQEWMTRVDVVLAQATRLSDDTRTINRWFKGWCCFRFDLCFGQTAQASELSDQAAVDTSCCCKCCACFSLGRRAKKDIIIIQGLCDEGIAFSTDVFDPKPAQAFKPVVTEDFSSFASRVSTAEEIRKALLDDAINLVGVYGMPGVGKTTLIKAIAKQVKEEHLFQEVAVVVVSQNPSLIKIQGDIAKKLGLPLDGDDMSSRAERLSGRLNQDNKTTLVILDDVWDRIELSEIGIPYKNNGSCCKVVLTTRDQGVCDRMEANANIKVAVLSREESWVLFREKSGNVEDSSLARDILNECKGLPLAIVSLGWALRCKDATVWADTLGRLRNSILKGTSSVVSSIKLSYDFLESKSIKLCFLYFCLFPEDHRIKLNVVLSYVMGEKLLEDVDTYENARGRLYTIVDELVSSGLLMRNGNGDITMHDVVRDVAISIAKEEHMFIVKAGRSLSYWPDMELGNCKRLSMMHNLIERLPTILIKASHLQALFLNDNYQLTELPSDVFANMKCLMTLDLSNKCIKSLPPSLSCLQNLHTLLLNCTWVTVLSPIEQLEKLEVLSLRYSRDVEGFPEEMEKLSNLRILDLTGTDLVTSIKPNLFSKLYRLEGFHVLESYSSLFGSPVINIFPEIGSLSRLTSLEMQVYNPELCHRDIPGPWQKLTRFRIIVKSSFENVLDQYEGAMSCLWLTEIRGKEVANWILVLLGTTNYLDLKGCDDIQRLTELGVKGMNHNLRWLRLESCPKMECLISNMGLLVSEENAFGNLAELQIEAMGAFVEICKGTPPSRFLSKLKKLDFGGCDSLLTAVPRKLIQNLQNLESFEIRNCQNLLYVLETEEEAEPEPSQVSDIRRISEPLLLPIFPNLKHITMVSIPKIRYVFTMRVARNLLQLKYLKIKECYEMEVIFKYEDGEDIKCDQDHKDSAILPRLNYLKIWSAPKLKSFTNQNLVMELPSLESLEMYECGILERLPFGATSVPILKRFTVYIDAELSDRLEWEDESVKSRLEAILQIHDLFGMKLKSRTVDDEKRSSNNCKSLKKWKSI